MRGKFRKKEKEDRREKEKEEEGRERRRRKKNVCSKLCHKLILTSNFTQSVICYFSLFLTLKKEKEGIRERERE